MGAGRDDTASTEAGTAGPELPPPPERYVLLDRIGEGGMGVVWKAHDRVLDRSVAIKLLHDQFLGAAHQARLAEEARAMAKLSHPNIVSVFDVGEHAGRTFLTMELIRGQPLSQWLETPRRWPAVVAVLRAAGEGLAAAHAAGVLHRDIKPSNLLVGDDGRVLVADFGVAVNDVVPRDCDPGAMHTAGIAGTPAYMAPERFDGEPASARSDQFSFAVALWEALYGRRPYDAPTIAEMRGAMERPPPPPTRLVPARIHRVVARALAVDPAARFPSMRAMLEALEPRRRWPWALAAVAVAGGGLAFALAPRSEPEPPCRGADRQLAGIWDDAARARGSAAFLVTKLSFAADSWHATEGALDRYATEWTGAWMDACQATRVDRRQDERTLELRMGCLSKARASMRRIVQMLETIESDSVHLAPELPRSLPAIAACADLEALTAASPRYAWSPERDAEATLDRALERLSLRDFTEARKAVAQILAFAQAAGNAWLEASALIVRGRVELAEAQPTAALETFTGAERAADVAGARPLVIDAWVGRVRAHTALSALDEAAALLDRAYAAVVGSDYAREAQVSLARVAIHQRRGRHADALDELHRARKLEMAAYGNASLEVELQIAEEKLAVGNVGDALIDARAVLAAVVSLRGEHSPFAARFRRRVAAILQLAGHDDEARVELTRARDDLDALGQVAEVAELERELAALGQSAQ